MSQQSVARHAGSDHHRAAPAAGLIGRGQELVSLTRALARPPAVVLIEGEAGIGKSKLLCAYLTSAAGREQRALVARCPPFRRPQTLGPLTDALRELTDDVAGLPLTGLAGVLRPFFPEWAASLPAGPEPAEDATAARHRVFRALAELIGCLRVATVVVEDAHWADEATLEFLLYLASRDSWPVSLVVTFRPEDLPARSLLPRLSRLAAGAGGLRLTLAPLDVADTTALVSSMLAGEQVSAQFAAFVHKSTEGVPLAVEELIKLMADRADLARRGGRWIRRSLTEIVVPPTVRDAVLERADRLSPQAQAVLRSAAVLAGQTDEALLSTMGVLSAGQARAGLAEALRSGLLREDARGLVSFRHALVGQAVYDAIAGPDRRALHLRAGQALERHSPSPVARLARHFREAGEIVRWSRYAEQSADLALASGDEITAQNLLHDLVVNAGLPAGVVARLLKKIPSATYIDAERQANLTRTLRSLLDSPTLGSEEEADLRVHLGEWLTARHDWGPARAEFERSIPGLAHDPAEAARAMMLLAWPHGSACPVAEHLRWLRRADRLAASLDPAHRLRLLVDRVSALLMLGQDRGWTEAAKIPEDSDQPRLRQQIARGHLNIGDEATRWGRYEEAGRRLVKALELANEHQYLHMREAVEVGLLHLRWLTGSWDGLAEQAARQADDEDILPMIRAEAAMVAGLAHATVGASDAAEEHLWIAHRDLRQRGEADAVVEAAAALARLRLADGRLDDALEVLAEPMALVAAKGIWVWATDLAPVAVQALVAAGRLDEAEDLARSFAAGLRGRHAPAPLAALAGCRALLAEARADHVRAAALFGRAAAAWEELPRPYDAWLARERQARCVLAAGDHDRGMTMLGDVLDRLHHLGAVADAARIKREMRAQGGGPDRRARGGRPGYGNQLSPRELDVARLLVTGGTNRQIGEQLFLSPKTVARHLDSAMRKLGAGSRTALAVRLVEDGLVSAG
jgi:DNA-binding CsgD family transcriptional regulator/tetratricopeptide (TPR) repeat protein